MEMGEYPNSKKADTEVVPSLFKIISSNEVLGFDTVEGNEKITNQCQQSGSGHLPSLTMRETESQPEDSNRIQSVSISMPTTPSGQSQTPRRVFFNDQLQVLSSQEVPEGSDTSVTVVEAAPTKFYSQPMPRTVTYVESANGMNVPQNQNQNQNPEAQGRSPRVDRLRDKRFDSFKTWSGRLERQLSQLRGRPVEASPEQHKPASNADNDALPVDRYFDALEGPELDTLRPSEELMLPEDRKWPFLLRFPVSSFGICLGVSSQAILYKTLATSPSTKFLHISLDVNLVLWSISIALIVAITLIYALKMFLYFEAVRREYYHPIRVNFFFAPFIALLFLAMGVPPSITTKLPHALWYVLMTPFLCLELKIYGQWMSGGQRRLSKVANPSNHLSVVGNFVGALFGASLGLKEGPLFFFAVGLAHYTVLFVTLYQRLPTNETLPKELHPVFFLFVAAPSVASMAWANIQGSFDYGSRIAYFIALFLYFSLAVRINFFRGFRFSLAWWAYTFPMTGAAIATIKYSNEVTNWVTRSLAITLSVVATLVVTALLVTTLIHAFVFRNLFPNDISIAISDRPPKPRKRSWFPIRHGSSDNSVEHYLKFVTSDNTKDLESSVDSETHQSVDAKSY